MSDRKLLHRAEYLAYQLVAGFTQRLPLRALRAWGRGVGKVAFHLLRSRRALTLENLEHGLPELDPAGRLAVARRCFEVQGATYHEQVWALRRGRAIADRFEIVGREHFDAAHRRGKGVFVLTGHYGCWELAGYPISSWIGSLHIVARPQNNPYLAAHFERLRERNGNVQIDRDRAGRPMLKVLKQGGTIGIALDQRVRPLHGVLVPFLGRYAWTSRLPAYLSTVTGCAAVPLVCVPLADGRYRMTFDPPILPEGKGDDEIERLTSRYVAALEPYIRAQPELWLWMHSRWRRTRPLRKPDAIARLAVESGLPDVEPLEEAARRAAPSSPLRRIHALAGDALLEDCRHLLLATDAARHAVSGDAATAPPPATAAAAALGAALVRRGHAIRYLTLDALRDRLQAADAEGRLGAAMRELDAVPLVIVDHADPSRLDRQALDLVASFLGHRSRRGSVVLAGADAARWRDAARSGGPDARRALEDFVASCEVVDLRGLDSDDPLAPAGATATTPARAETDAEAPAV